MKLFIPLLFLLVSFASYGQNHTRNGNDSQIRTIWLNPLRALPQEAIFIIHRNSDTPIKGYLFGVIYPNKFLADNFRPVHTTTQLKFSKKGLAGGFKFDFGENDRIVYYSLFRYSFNNSIEIHREYPSGGTDVYTANIDIDQKEASLNLYFESIYETGKQRVGDQIYVGLGVKVFYRHTFYNEYQGAYHITSGGENEDKELNTRYPDEMDSWVKVSMDNGFFILPTVHLGYRIGWRFRK